MDKAIGIGVIIGIVIIIGSFVYESDFYSKTQKKIILISFIFPPGALVILALISLYNYFLK